MNAGQELVRPGGEEERRPELGVERLALVVTALSLCADDDDRGADAPRWDVGREGERGVPQPGCEPPDPLATVEEKSERSDAQKVWVK
nr:hypothetical protein [Frankia sp. Cas3]